MPTAINPNNYNIDFFQSYSFGEITDSNYLNYLFGQNLASLPDELVNGPAGNFTSKYNEKGLEKDINYTTISNPGSIDEWLLEGNFPVNLFEVSYQNPSQNVGANQYGPPSLQAFNYENPQLIAEDTGFIQYPTSVGGGIVTTILNETLDAVGISSTNFINFDSPLNDIAKERRLAEAKNRIKDGIIENTIGRINLDPLGLLAGQPLFGKDYTITKPAGGILGSAINIASDIAGLNTLALTELFGGPIPDGAFDWDAPLDDPFSVNTIDITEKLLERTGKGTRNLLFDALAANKYGPVIEGQNNTLSEPPKSDDSNQPTQKGGYLAYGEIKKVESRRQQETNGTTSNSTTPLTEQQALSQSQQNSGLNLLGVENTANKSAKDITSNLPSTDNLNNLDRSSRPDVPIEPTEADNPSLGLKTVETLKFQGFEFEPNGVELDPTYNNFKDGWDRGHNENWRTQYSDPRQIIPFGPEVSPGSETGNDGPEPNNRVWNKELYWRDGRTENLPKRGLLSYTQKLINKSTNVNGTAARFIGMPNSDQNYELQGKGTDRRHVEMSMGNLVKDTKKNADGKEPYCRSWSVRNAYDKYNNLIRSDALWRLDQPGTVKVEGEPDDPSRRLGTYSTLRDPGMPKIAWEKDGIDEERIRNGIAEFQSMSIPEKYVIPYMFSIENLAWKDSPHYTKLPLCEKGPHGGRIMWFPPYNIKFTDNTTVNWDTTSFIGRAEPIYTYNNTERTGTLSFSIVVDHPSIINKLKKGELTYNTTDEQGNVVANKIRPNLETFFAGCNTDEIKAILQEIKTIPKIEETEIEDIPEEKPNIITIDIPEIKDELSFHFKNAENDDIKDGDVKKNDVYSQQQDIIINSSCPKGIVGRCFDTNYEKSTLKVYDNPKLYKGGSNASNVNFGCDETNTVIPDNITTTGSNLEVIPVSQKIKPPCYGLGSKADYGPRVNASTKDRWKDGGVPNITDPSNTGNYCCQKVPNTYVSGTTTFKTNQVGYYVERFGGNERFWGTGNYPFNTPQGQLNKPPKLDLSGVEVAGKFVASPNGVAGLGISQLIEFLATTPLGKHYQIIIEGNCSNFASSVYNTKLGKDRADSVKEWMKAEMIKAEKANGGPPKLEVDNESCDVIDLYSESSDFVESCGRWNAISKGKDEASSINGNTGDNNAAASSGKYTLTPAHYHPVDPENIFHIAFRRVDIRLKPRQECVKQYYDKLNEQEKLRVQGINDTNKKIVEEQRNKEKARVEAEKRKLKSLATDFFNECDYFEVIKKTDSFLYDSLSSKLKNFHPAFHAITPEGLNSRLTFLQQCGRQGPSFIDPNQPQNTAFGRPPVAILRIGDFYFSKIIIDSINFDFDPLQWDLNPEGIGVQPMVVNVDMNFKFIGGSTLQGPLRQLQNAVSYNFFANTAIYMPLEKILAKRAEKGFIVEGENGYDENTAIPETYYYGPWASQKIADETIIADQNARQALIDSTKDVEQADNESQIENKTVAPCEGGILLTKEEIEQQQNIAANLDPFPYETYNYWRCGNDLKILPKEEANPLNTVPGQPQTPQVPTATPTQSITETPVETPSNQQQSPPNTTTNDGVKPFAETNANRSNPFVSENSSGKLKIQGDFRDVSSGEGNFFETGFGLLGGLIPKFVYAAIDTKYTDDWEITVTSDSNSTGSNNAYVYDGTDYKDGRYTCCSRKISNGNAPTNEAFKQIAAFNFLESITEQEYNTLKKLKEDFKNNNSNFMDDLKDGVEKNGKASYSGRYYIQLNSKKEGEEGKVIGGSISYSLEITKKGYERLVKELTEEI